MVVEWQKGPKYCGKRTTTSDRFKVHQDMEICLSSDIQSIHDTETLNSSSYTAVAVFGSFWLLQDSGLGL